MFAATSLARLARPASIIAFGLAVAAAGPTRADPGIYATTNLDSDVAGVAITPPDPDLVNPWGVAFNPNGFVWVNDNHTGKSTLYDGNGVKQGLVVTIPAAVDPGQGTPTGITYNGTSDFRIATAPGATPVVAPFIFVSEDGLISAWAPPLTTAVRVAVNSEASYKGAAIAANGTANQLYAADFPGRKIDVYTAAFAPTTTPGHFEDPAIPSDFGPFNIANIQGNLYVAFAKVGAGGDEEAGPGLGFVDVFDADGFLLHRLVTRGPLNAPWGMALAPAGFGRFSNRLLVGNFGDGVINAFDVANGHFAGALRAGQGKPLAIEGLWGIAFGSGVRSQPVDTLFFAAGTDDEQHGLYGRIDPVTQGHDGDEH